MLKKASGEIADKECKDQAAKFFNRYNAEAAAATTAEAKAEVKARAKKGQARTGLRSMAIQVASFFYSSSKRSEEWLEQAERDGMTEAEKALDAQAAAGNEGHGQEKRKEEERALNEALFKPASDPLAVAEVPQFVRDTINALFPSLSDEIQLKMIEVPEMDVVRRQ